MNGMMGLGYNFARHDNQSGNATFADFRTQFMQTGAYQMKLQSKLGSRARNLLCLGLLSLFAATASAQSRYEKVLQEKKVTVGAQEGSAPYG